MSLQGMRAHVCASVHVQLNFREPASQRLGPGPLTCFSVFYSRVTLTLEFISSEGHVLVLCHLIGSWVAVSPRPLGSFIPRRLSQRHLDDSTCPGEQNVHVDTRSLGPSPFGLMVNTCLSEESAAVSLPVTRGELPSVTRCLVDPHRPSKEE